jgi:hypothetical protein
LGAWHDQDDYEILALNIAASAKVVYSKEKWDEKDAEFVAWVVEGEDDT